MKKFGSLFFILQDIKIEHTVFALPFALLSAFVAADGLPDYRILLLAVIALLFARSAAMAFNRVLDLKFDKANPRTMNRPLAKGLASRSAYITFIVASSVGFIITSYLINTTSFMLSFLALFVLFFYSVSKRFTSFTHFFLGVALGFAPLGGWVAVRDSVSVEPLILVLAVVFWLFGLDLIYSCQDFEFDSKTQGIYSLPKRVGIAMGLKLSFICHMIMLVFLFLFGFLSGLSVFYWIGFLIIAALLFYEHYIVTPDDLSKVNIAFFNLNGYVSILFASFGIADILLT